MEKKRAEPHLPDRLVDPKLPAVHGAFAPGVLEQRNRPGHLPPDIAVQNLENRKLEQL